MQIRVSRVSACNTKRALFEIGIVKFIKSPSKAALSHRKLATAGNVQQFRGSLMIKGYVELQVTAKGEGIAVQYRPGQALESCGCAHR